MQNNVFYPVALVLIIGIAFYFLYGNYFSLSNVDYAKYQEVCNSYLQAEAGKYSRAELESLVNKVNYLLPDEPDKLTVPIQKQVKTCAAELAKRLAKEE